jgi:hypothetical protein
MNFLRPGILTFFASVPENEIWQFQCSTDFFLYLNKKAETGKTGWQKATYRWTTGIPVVAHAPQFEKPCFRLIKISMSKVLRGSQDSTVHTATCYRLDDLGFKSWWEQEFSLYIRPNWTHQPPVPWIPGLFTRGKAAGAWCWSSALIYCWDYAWVELYLHSLLYASHVNLQGHFTFIVRHLGESIQINIYLMTFQFG